MPGPARPAKVPTASHVVDAQLSELSSPPIRTGVSLGRGIVVGADHAPTVSTSDAGREIVPALLWRAPTARQVVDVGHWREAATNGSAPTLGSSAAGPHVEAVSVHEAERLPAMPITVQSATSWHATETGTTSVMPGIDGVGSSVARAQLPAVSTATMSPSDDVTPIATQSPCAAHQIASSSVWAAPGPATMVGDHVPAVSVSTSEVPLPAATASPTAVQEPTAVQTTPLSSDAVVPCGTGSALRDQDPEVSVVAVARSDVPSEPTPGPTATHEMVDAHDTDP